MPKIFKKSKLRSDKYKPKIKHEPTKIKSSLPPKLQA